MTGYVKGTWGIIIACMLSISVQAQVVNIENRRMGDNRQGWTGQGEFSYAYIQNQSSISNLNARTNFMYARLVHKVMFINDFSFIQSSEGDFENRGYQHIRYNYQKTDRLTYEAYVQIQYNQQMRLYPRYIAGIGPRYKVHAEDSIRVFVGASIFAEHEQLKNPSETNTNERFNFYLALNFFKIPGVTVDFLAMYQPRLVHPSDRRIQTELRLDFPISKLLQFRLSASIFNDSRPPDGVPKTFTNMRNGILFTF
jgi:putative salt-induced outer membrane protein YdiY